MQELNSKELLQEAEEAFLTALDDRIANTTLFAGNDILSTLVDLAVKCEQTFIELYALVHATDPSQENTPFKPVGETFGN